MSRPARLLLRLLLALALAFSMSISASAATRYAARKDVRQFISQMVHKHGFVRKELRTLFSKARYQPAVAYLDEPRPNGDAASETDGDELDDLRDEVASKNTDADPAED